MCGLRTHGLSAGAIHLPELRFFKRFASRALKLPELSASASDVAAECAEMGAAAALSSAVDARLRELLAKDEAETKAAKDDALRLRQMVRERGRLAWRARQANPSAFKGPLTARSEERRVGEECRSRRSTYH